MNEHKCLDILMNPSCSIEQKAEELAAYIHWYKAVGRNMGFGVRYSMPLAFRLLFEALPKGNEKAQSELRSTLDAIRKHSEQVKSKRSDKKKEMAKELRSIPPGTPIKICERGKVKAVTLLEVKRTRFIFEDSDGRRFSISVGAFRGKAEGKKIKRLPEEIREKRELIRALAGRSSARARAEILKSGIGILNCLLDELKAAMQRIDEAPSGLSNGVFRNSLGVVKKVNPYDEALVKQIPKVVSVLAEKNGIERIQKEIEQYPDTDVKKCVIKAITEMK
jgi:hypothetical protein